MLLNLRLLLVEPYYGGSHRSFLDGLQRHLPFDFSLLSLPAHSWKWRMRFSAPWCAGQLPAKRHVDGLLCSTFIDVASLRGLGPSWLQDVPISLYFHENQFAYPVRHEDERDYHYGLTNYLSALAADELAFNSRYNLDSFLAGCRLLEKKAPDVKLQLADDIAAKAQVLAPPLDFSQLDSLPEPGSKPGPPTIVWNHRWEHDKNPVLFFTTLFSLAEQGLDFRLMVLGQSFRQQPAIFSGARQRLGQKIIHWGFVEDRHHYLQLLQQADLVVSTANHEFFGLAVLEAVRAGCRPLLPQRLSYPELFPADYLYKDDSDLLPALAELLSGEDLRLSPEQGQQLTEPFSWTTMAGRFQNWLLGGRVVDPSA